MADGHARTTGRLPRKVILGDREYTMRPFTVGILAEMESYIISMREDPIVAAAKAAPGVSDEFRKEMWDAAMRASVSHRMVTSADQAAFENSVRGLSFKLWTCLRDDQPEFKTPDDAMKLISDLALTYGDSIVAQIAAQVDVSSGLVDLGNLSGPSMTRASQRLEDAPALADGQESTDTSPKSTDGTASE